MSNLFVQTLETARILSLKRDFLVCFAVNANNFIFSDNVCILCLSCNVKKYKTSAILSEKTEISVVLIVFDGVLCEVSILLPYLTIAL